MNTGWILLFYLGENQLQDENARQNFPYLSWSPYDRLDIVPISEFSGFFGNQYSMRWEGVAQQMHLIPEYPAPFVWTAHQNDSNKTSYLITNHSCKQQFSLNCIITTRFNKKLGEERELRKKVYKQLDQAVGSAGLSLDWAAFNSLDSESIVFILLADDIKTFATFGEILKNAKACCGDRKEDLFTTVTSFAAFNEKDWTGDPKADLIVRLNLKSQESYQPVVNQLIDIGVKKDNIVNLFLGKCVLDVRIECDKNSLSLYLPDGIFNGESKFYKNNIESSRSYWCVELQNTESFVIKVKEFNDLEIGSCYSLNNEADEYTSYPLVQFVLKEYERLIKSEQCSSWASILYLQYETVCKLVKEYVEEGNEKQLYSLVKKLTNVLQHIRQACTPVAEIPYHNYTYSGSYNDILKMYYGVVAVLFEIGFQMPHSDQRQQHRIMFCVDFESAPEIHSSMYSSKSDDNERFIVFHLPFNSFANIEKTVKLLSHEVFHYVAPYDRGQRNELLVESWTRTLFNRALKFYEEGGIPQNIVEWVLKKLWNNQELYKDCYNIVIGVNPGIKGCILNDFIMKGINLRSLSGALQSVGNEIISRIHTVINNKCDNQEEYTELLENLQQLEKNVRKKIYGTITKKYVQTEIIKNARAYKEVFCDLSMIHIFGMQLNDYIKWFYEVSFYRFRKIFKENLDSRQLEGKNIRIMSFELRMSIVFDMFCGEDDPRESANYFRNNIEELLSEKTDMEGLDGFIKYCERFYSQYLTQKNLFRNLYQRMFDKTLGFWEELPQSALRLTDDVKKTMGIGNKIDLCTDVIDLFINKNIMKEFKELQNKSTGEEQGITSIKVRVLSNLSLGETEYVTDLASYISSICEKTKNMRNNSAVFGDSCWYRGVCDHRHTLLPGLYRLYDSKNEPMKMSPYVKQAEILKDAYYLTMNMPALWTEQLQGIPEHMCCLQHYGMTTNLLDFSLDMLVALHFALNPDCEEDKIELEEGTYSPRVVIFNPAKYNKAIMSLREGYIKPDTEHKLPSPVLFDVCNEEMDDYFVGEMGSEKFAVMNREFFDEVYKPDVRINKYPVPVIIRQSNSRILAQNGIFLAYSLSAGTDMETGDFTYLDLRNIQTKYLALFDDQKEAENEKFLEEIAVEPASVRNLQEELKILGLNKGKMYPELSKIFEQYKEN